MIGGGIGQMAAVPALSGGGLAHDRNGDLAFWCKASWSAEP
jgi:hypothetical protein